MSRFVPDERVLGRLVVALAALSAYEALFVLQLNATPGKLATSLRVAEVGRPVTDPLTAWIRGAVTSVATLALVLVPSALGLTTESAAGLIVGGMVVTVAGGYLLSVLSSPLRRGVADRIAGTIVVPFEAPATIEPATVAAHSGAPRPPHMTAWGPVGSLDARRRARAARLDDSPVLVITLVAVIVAWAIDGSRAFALFGVRVPAAAAVLALLWVVLFVIDETWRVARDGGTAAHRREGLAVVDESTGEPPSRRQALARAVVLAVFWLFPPLVPILALWMASARDGQGPHDLVAGTAVIDTTTGGR